MLFNHHKIYQYILPKQQLTLKVEIFLLLLFCLVSGSCLVLLPN